MPVAGQPCQAVSQLVGQPGVDGIGIARLQPALAGDGMCRHPIGDLQHRGTALAHVRLWVVVARLFQLALLCTSQGHRPLRSQGILPSTHICSMTMATPY
jgi:hypothetical protein